MQARETEDHAKPLKVITRSCAGLHALLVRKQAFLDAVEGVYDGLLDWVDRIFLLVREAPLYQVSKKNSGFQAFVTRQHAEQQVMMEVIIVAWAYSTYGTPGRHSG